MKSILFILGTRPEAIKLAPLIKAFQKNDNYNVKICITAQHRQMLDQVLNFFDIVPDYDLDIMKPNQSLFQLTSNILLGLEPVFDEIKPELVFLQGDTTTVLSGALAAFYKKVKIAHVEAGLRSYDNFSPFPEEANRCLTSKLSDFHFVPTEQALQNLINEGITKNVFLVGNTVIDALQLGLSIIETDQSKFEKHFRGLDFSKRIILVTCHRRENFGSPFENICNALLEIAQDSTIQIVYPVHLNPNIKNTAEKLLQHPNIKLIDPLEYPYLLWLMNKSHIVLTDSGGIQEEAPSLGKPVLVLRETSERPEGIEAGNAILVGTDKIRIVNEVKVLLNNSTVYQRMAKIENPYGDGTASIKIINHIQHF